MKAKLQKEFDKLESKRKHLSYDEANAIEVKLLRILTKYLTEEIERLKSILTENIKECERFEKTSAKQGKYTDAIKLQGMTDAYKKTLWKVERILTTEDKLNQQK